MDASATADKPRSLYRELSLALILVISLASITVNLLYYSYLTRSAEVAFEQRASEYAVHLHDSLEWPLWNVDDELAGKIGRAFIANAEISLLTIRDDQRRVVYHGENPGGKTVLRQTSIQHNGQEIGSIEIGLSLRVKERLEQQLLWGSLITIALLITTLYFSTRLLLAKLLTRPLDILSAATGNIVEGKYHELDLSVTYEEFADIIARFRGMSDAVASRESHLRESNEQLASEIDERKRTEVALRESEERLNLATTVGKIGVWDWNVVTDELIWDESMYVLYGVLEDDFGGAYEAWSKTLHPDDRQFVDNEIQAALHGKRECSPEFRIVRPDGSVRFLKAISKTYFDPQGNPIRMVGTNVDITEHKRVEEVLQASKVHLQQLLENLPVAILVYRADSSIEYGNSAALQILDMSKDQLLGKTAMDPHWHFVREDGSILPLDDYPVNRVIEEKEPLRDVVLGVIATADASPRWVYVYAFSEKDESGELERVIVSFMDITERLHAEADLKRYKDHLEEEVQQRTADLVLARNAAEAANRAKSVFLASMSHELRTPLNAILGFSNLMRKDSLLHENQRQNLDIINRSGEHLLTLINDVLEVAKIEAGRVQLEEAPFDLGGMVRDVTDMMQLRAEEKGLQLLVDQSSQFPRHIVGDEARLRQVLINLIGNAVKFTQQGGVTLRLGTRKNKISHLRIEVEDSGPGIAQEDQPRIFEPFVQLGEQGGNKGTGLGLTITRQFVQLMGGGISLESTPGKGSLFRIDLPLREAAEADIAKPKEPEKGEVVGLAPGQPECRVLIVEDQLDNQLLLAKLMETVGIQVKLAENGEQGVQLFQSWRPHLIWMDRRMPVMDGLEATKAIRRLPGGKEVKIVAVTASAFKEQRDELLNAGMDDFVRKPYRSSEIYDCLSKQLGVNYIYEGIAESDEPAVILAPEMLAVLPEALRSELRNALESLESERIALVIEQVAPYDPKLQRALAQLAENFDYPTILRAIQSN